jgi:hypothetical protein
MRDLQQQMIEAHGGLDRFRPSAHATTIVGFAMQRTSTKLQVLTPPYEAQTMVCRVGGCV